MWMANINKMKNKILFITALLISIAETNAQETYSDSLNNTTVEARPKALHIGGATAFLGGASLGVIVHILDEYPRKGLPFISSTIAVAPTSLVAMGLGELFSKRPNKFTDSFKVNLGMSYSSPVFSEFIEGNKHRAGVNLAVISPKLSNWRYKLSFSKYFSEEFDFEGIESYRGYTNLSWWEMDLDLQYIIDINDDFLIYPFLGTQYNSIYSDDGHINSEILANYGVGTNYMLSNRLGLSFEMRYTLDVDDNPGNMILNLGVIYNIK